MSTSHEQFESKVSSLDSVLAEWTAEHPGAVPGVASLVDLRTRLIAREDNMADVLRLAGVQFGLFPQIVAEVLAEVGMGSPMGDDERMFIRRQFAELMEKLQREYDERDEG